MKYIDADKLRKKIAEQMDTIPREVGRGAGTITSKGYGMMQAFQIVRSIIDSLEQEQPEALEVSKFCQPVPKNIANCVAEHYWEMLNDEKKEDETKQTI